MKRFIFLLFGSLGAWSLGAQSAAPALGYKHASASRADSVFPAAQRLRDAFKQGHLYGNFRSFFMATDNAASLSDPYALAAGGSLSFQTAVWRGFSFGLGGVFNFNLASSDLSRRDSLTQAANRYEIGLFDVENPKNRNDLDRMEAFWLRYAHRKTSLTLGQQLLQTPFVNHQDGRMRPTAESGIWLKDSTLHRTHIEGGWLWRISPRSTVRWYSVSTSIGLYPQGLNPDGSRGNYSENLSSKGIGLLGITRRWGQHLKVQVWDQWVENIFNTAFVQADYTHPLRNGADLLMGLQLTRQDALRDGGNADVTKTYFQRGGRSNIVGMQSGWQNRHWRALLAYTRVTADGRFLAPREWGREPFYTFMSRERVEGSGDSHSLTARLRWQKTPALRLEVAYGHFYLPDVRHIALNKYAFPAFRQINLEARYAFHGLLEGLQAQLLYVWKGRIGDVYGRPNLIIHRVDMSQYNVVLNYLY